MGAGEICGDEDGVDLKNDDKHSIALSQIPSLLYWPGFNTVSPCKLKFGVLHIVIGLLKSML